MADIKSLKRDAYFIKEATDFTENEEELKALARLLDHYYSLGPLGSWKKDNLDTLWPFVAKAGMQFLYCNEEDYYSENTPTPNVIVQAHPLGITMVAYISDMEDPRPLVDYYYTSDLFIKLRDVLVGRISEEEND